MKSMLLASAASLIGFGSVTHATAQAVGSSPSATPSAPAPDAAVAAPPAQESASTSTADIVVTARRRDESLSKVPIAISVLTPEALQKQGIRSEQDLQLSVPGLLIQQGGSSNTINYAIRGQTIDQYTSSPPAILPYINEFQAKSASASTFFDLENVQVLKGPQGTLFGRNTTGGAVLYTTVQPGDELKGFLMGRVANFNQRQLQFGVTLPLADFASLRLAGNYSEGGGFVRNLGFYDGIGGAGGNFVPLNRKLGNNKNRSFRATLKLSPSDSLTNTTTVQFTRDRGTSIPALLYTFNPLSFPAPFTSGQAAPFETLAEFLAFQLGTVRKTYTNSNWRNRALSTLVTNTTQVELSDNVLFKNIIGWNRTVQDNVFDLDGTPFHLYETVDGRPGQRTPTSQFSEEFQVQLTGLDNSLTAVAGVFYSNQRDTIDNHLNFYGAIPQTYNYFMRDRSIAGFAQATYNFTDQLHLTGGFRYSQDKINVRQLPMSIYAPGGVAFSPAFEQEQDVKFKKPSWTVSLDYQLTPALLFYVTHRGSWRAGGFNFSAPPITATGDVGGSLFLPETTKDVEVGAKFNGRVADIPVTATISLYNQWVDNVQRGTFVPLAAGPALVTSNVPKAQITGQEASLNVSPAHWLTFGGQVSHVNARFTSPNTVAFGQPVVFGPFAYAPKWSGSVYAEITKPMAGGSSISLRGDVYAQSSFYFSNLANTVNPGTRIPGYALANARLSWNNLLGTQLTAALYAKNIFDKQYYVGGLAAGNAFGTNSVSPGMPASYGLELRFNF